VSVAELIAQLPAIACLVVTLAAFMAAGAWRAPLDAGAIKERRDSSWKIVAPAILGLVLVAAAILLSPEGRPSEDAATPRASYGAKSALFQLALNATIVAPFITWVVWRRLGAAALGVGKQDLLPSLAVGACASLACVVMLGKLSTSFWLSPGTWWLLLSMLGVGASEELIFRGFALSALGKRWSRPSAEVGSAAIFAVVHIPQRLGRGVSMTELAVSIVILLVWGWCYAAAMRRGRNVPGLALVHAVTNVCVNS